jgi:hypothetical protein
VNGEHLLYEGPPEMKQAHWERAFVFCSECDTFFLQELAEVGAQLYSRGGFPAAGGARFEEHAIGDFAGAGVKLGVQEMVIAPEPADGSALLGNKLKSWMSSYRIPQLLQFAVDASFGQSGVEGKGIKKDV